MLTKEEIKQINKLTKTGPYFKSLIKKKYKSPKGYPEYKKIMFDLAKLLTILTPITNNELKMLLQDFTSKCSLITLQQNYHLGFQSFWLNPNLLTAFNYTNLPEEIPYFPRKVTCGLLILPPILKAPDGEYVKWLMFYHHQANEVIPDIMIGNNILQIPNIQSESISWFTLLDDGVQYASNHCIFEDNNKLILDVDNNYYINEVIGELGKNIDTKTEQEFTNKITQIILQTLLYLHLKNISLSDKIDKSSKILEPFILGQNYQVITETSEGTKKRTHWRRGFFRWQPYGSRENPDYKLIWIEPMLING